MKIKIKILDLTVYLLLSCAACSLVSGCSTSRDPEKVSGTITSMGTFLEISLYSDEFDRRYLEKAIEGAFAIASSLEKKLSFYDPDSELNYLNTVRDAEVSVDLWKVIKKARDVYTLTGGAFDPTIAPFLKERGFYEGLEPELMGRIPEAVQRLGMREHVELETSSRRVILGQGAWLDLSGIAKGYVVDRISDFLERRGIDDHIVNAGGDMYCGMRASGRPMRIGLRKPAEGEILLVIGISGKALATSGDYEKVVLNDDGTMASHIFDPLSLRSLEKGPSSFTVIAHDCMTADALATGMMAMGREKALLLADNIENIELIIAGIEGDADKVYYSSGARRYLLGR